MAKTAEPNNVREWVPSCFLMLHEPAVASTYRFTPSQMQRDEVRYFSSVKLYGRSPVHPIWSREFGPIGLHDIASIGSAEVARDLGVERFMAYGEAFNHTPDMAPATANISMPAHLHYTSSDGSFFGHLASFFIFGAPRSVQRGELYYENFPGARIDADDQLAVFTINPFVRASKFTVRLVYCDGRTWESPSQTVRAKGVAQWSSAGADCPVSTDPVGVIVVSELKQSSFFATRDSAGRMIGLDHGHPFLAQVLDHR